MSEIHENIDHSEETLMKHREGGCPLGCSEHGHAWMIGVPLGAHYAVYDCGTWAFPANRIGFADAIAFAAENGQDVFFMHDTCGKEHDGVVWSFLEYFPKGTEGHRPPSSTGANDQHHRRRQDHTMAHAAQEKDQESDF